MAEQREKDGQARPLRSVHNRHKSFVTFTNTTTYSVGLYWIDYQGRQVFYRALGHCDYVDINTFETHPWIFINEETKERFTGNGSKVYFPEPWDRGSQRPEVPPRIQRTQVRISMPLYSLRELCLRLIKRHLRSDHEAYVLEIPYVLQRELFHTLPRKPLAEES